MGLRTSRSERGKLLRDPDRTSTLRDEAQNSSLSRSVRDAEGGSSAWFPASEMKPAAIRTNLVVISSLHFVRLISVSMCTNRWRPGRSSRNKMEDDLTQISFPELALTSISNPGTPCLRNAQSITLN